MPMKETLRLGLIGSGFMGKAHVFGFAAAQRVFELPYNVELHCIADITSETAEAARRALGFSEGTDDWRSLIDDPEIEDALEANIPLGAKALGAAIEEYKDHISFRKK